MGFENCKPKEFAVLWFSVLTTVLQTIHKSGVMSNRTYAIKLVEWYLLVCQYLHLKDCKAFTLYSCKPDGMGNQVKITFSKVKIVHQRPSKLNIVKPNIIELFGDHKKFTIAGLFTT